MSNTYQYNSRILFNNNLAVTLVSGHNRMHNIKDCDRVVDIHADGSPIALQPVVGTDRAQIWSFLADLAETPTLQIDRAYKVVNSHTGTVLDVADTIGNPGTHTLNIVFIHLKPLTSCHSSLVIGLVSEGGDNHKVI